jgi:hypothetical protein
MSSGSNQNGKYELRQDLCVGTWQISDPAGDECYTNEKNRQEAYVAEVLNISGAPVNVYKLLGNHEQGRGSVLTKGTIISSPPLPGYPVSNLTSGSSWRSLAQGEDAVSVAFLGIDFGVKRLPNGAQEYAPIKSQFEDVGAITISQKTNGGSYAKQVLVQSSDGKCQAGETIFTGNGAGTIEVESISLNAVPATINAVAVSPTTFNVTAIVSGAVVSLGQAAVNQPFNSTYVNFTINQTAPYTVGDAYTFFISYKWQKEGLFNLAQTEDVQTLNFNRTLKIRAIKITPTMFVGSGSWEVSSLDFLDSPPTNINNIQDLFFNENRDRDYSKTPVLLKVQYSPADSASDLARFGLNILDQYAFTTSFTSMVKALGRPIVVGDIIEVVPELQYDQNLMPVKKFLEVSDTGWASEGFGPQWNPTVYRFSAQQALPSQETRGIFGTIDTQRFIVQDDILDQVASQQQIDVTPLIQTEEIIKAASDAVPEVGTIDEVVTAGVPVPKKKRAYNKRGQPEAPAAEKKAPGAYVEDGMPPNGLPFTEGYKLPEVASSVDGQYFRLNYPPETKIPTRLYRFSAVKNRWLYQETDRRGEYSSHKPTARGILESDTKRSIKEKNV